VKDRFERIAGAGVEAGKGEGEGEGESVKAVRDVTHMD